MLTIKDLHFRYHKPILKGLSLSVAKGEIVALIGCSGSGKTTLFRLITGLLQPTQGSVILTDGPPTYMQQEDLLLPWRTVAANLLLLQELGPNPSPISQEQLHHMLALVGLEGYEHLFPDQLSGGQRHRVSLARALLQNRPLVLLDEPFGSLDVVIREQLYALLLDIRHRLHKTMIFVTHDFRDAVELADRILVLKEGCLAVELSVHDLPSDQIYRQIRQLLHDTEDMTPKVIPVPLTPPLDEDPPALIHPSH